MAASGRHRGWAWDEANSRLSVFVDGTEIARFNDATADLTLLVNGLSTPGFTNSSGVFSNADGTVALPSYTFTCDPDSGMFRIGANSVGIAAAGADTLRITGTACDVTSVVIDGGATTVNASIAAIGETNTGLDVTTAGTGQLTLGVGGDTSLFLDDSAVTTAGAVHAAFLGSRTGTGDSIAGSNWTLSTGGASAASSSGAGDVGGTLALLGGIGSAGCTTGAGGAGGPLTLTSGAGAAGAGAANSGAGGAITVLTGVGAAGASNAASDGGASGAVSILSAVGGLADACGNDGGASGGITIGSGRGGGSGAACGDLSGAGGNVTIQMGRAGAAVTCGCVGANSALLILNDAGALGLPTTDAAACFTNPGCAVGEVFAVTTVDCATTTGANTAMLAIQTA